jgi:hypothetical protein
MYIIDHHHFVLAALAIKYIKEVYGNIIKIGQIVHI